MNGLARWRSLVASNLMILGGSGAAFARSFNHATSAQPLPAIVGILSAAAGIVGLIALVTLLLFRDRIVNPSR
jgi:hypothetical protein